MGQPNELLSTALISYLENLELMSLGMMSRDDCAMVISAACSVPPGEAMATMGVFDIMCNDALDAYKTHGRLVSADDMQDLTPDALSALQAYVQARG